MGFKRRESSLGDEEGLRESCVSVAAELSNSLPLVPSFVFLFLLPLPFHSPVFFFCFFLFFCFFEMSEIMERMDC